MKYTIKLNKLKKEKQPEKNNVDTRKKSKT